MFKAIINTTHAGVGMTSLDLNTQNYNYITYDLTKVKVFLFSLLYLFVFRFSINRRGVKLFNREYTRKIAFQIPSLNHDVIGPKNHLNFNFIFKSPNIAHRNPQKIYFRSRGERSFESKVRPRYCVLK